MYANQRQDGYEQTQIKPYKVLHLADGLLTLRLFDDDITRFPVGERLFERVADQYIPRVRMADPPHYRIKNMYFESADLNFYYTESNSPKQTISIRVALEDNPRIGGSVSYADLGLINRASVGAFASKFDQIRLVGAESKASYIADCILANYRPALEAAMRREIVEETTADRADAMWDVPLLYRRVGIEAGGANRTAVTFYFSGCATARKVREMDVFPMVYGGEEVEAYYVYGMGGGGRYLAKLPYRDLDEARGEGATETGMEAKAEAAGNWVDREVALAAPVTPLPAQQPAQQPEPPKPATNLPNVLAQTLLPENELNNINYENEIVMPAPEAPMALPRVQAPQPQAQPAQHPRIKINYNYAPRPIALARPPPTRRRFVPRPRPRATRRFRKYKK